jgi:hypothetical protein
LLGFQSSVPVVVEFLAVLVVAPVAVVVLEVLAVAVALVGLAVSAVQAVALQLVAVVDLVAAVVELVVVVVVALAVVCDEARRPATSQTLCESKGCAIKLGRLMAGHLRSDHASQRRLLRKHAG